MIENFNILLHTDSYKLFHRVQYPDNTTLIYSNFTPRSSRVPGQNHVVVFGIQYFIKEYLINRFDRTFFKRPKDEVVEEYRSFVARYCSITTVDTTHIEELHDLGYLPLCIKALPEGTRCPIGIPLLTIRNTEDKFAWLTNYIETMLSNVLWHPITSATTASIYRKVFNKYADETVGNRDMVGWQGHNFSYRGLCGTEAACLSDGGHLLSFTGTDTMPSTMFLDEYYEADSKNNLVAGSVAATEHSCQQSGILFESITKKINLIDAEVNFWDHLITEACPDGIISIVADTFSYWDCLTQVLPRLKDKIMARNGKVVVRPDSGDPVQIICGNPDAPEGSIEYKGSIELLWEVFGGKVNELGYKELDPHVGLIYGDSITLERQKLILEGLKKKGFASNNVVLGIGSFTYQYVTRDTYGFAVKSTYAIVNGREFPIFKDPKTDSGMKKSAKGLLAVVKQDDGTLTLQQECNWEEERTGELRTVFNNGTQYNVESLSTIRKRLYG
jgi:nicotinamide phosphoribosyltransferase